eukprot:3941812-Rhodomonas_salina.4
MPGTELAYGATRFCSPALQARMSLMATGTSFHLSRSNSIDLAMHGANVTVFGDSAVVYAAAAPVYGCNAEVHAGVQECRPCPEGQECVLSECHTCTPCRPGTYKDFVGTAPCKPCPNNTFSALVTPSFLTSCLVVGCSVMTSHLVRGSLERVQWGRAGSVRLERGQRGQDRPRLRRVCARRGEALLVEGDPGRESS